MKSKFTEDMDSVKDEIYIDSVRVDLRKCDVNGGMGVPNIFGRYIQKSIVFPVARVNYKRDVKGTNIEYNRTIDLKDAALTATNYEGVGCGMTYFIISNTNKYSLYDINGRFVRYIPIAEYGKIICLGAISFVTKSDNGIMHIWSSTGICSDDITPTIENQKRYGWQKGKLIKKAVAYCHDAPKDENLYF